MLAEKFHSRDLAGARLQVPGDRLRTWGLKKKTENTKTNQPTNSPINPRIYPSYQATTSPSSIPNPNSILIYIHTLLKPLPTHLQFLKPSPIHKHISQPYFQFPWHPRELELSRAAVQFRLLVLRGVLLRDPDLWIVLLKRSMLGF